MLGVVLNSLELLLEADGAMNEEKHEPENQWCGSERAISAAPPLSKHTELPEVTNVSKIKQVETKYQGFDWAFHGFLKA